MAEALLVQRLANKPAFIGGTQRVNAGYSGPILRVHDGTTTKDVGSLAQAASFFGAHAGTVDILYDQSGNGRDFPFNLARPLLWDGSAFYRAGSSLSIPGMRFTAAQDFMRASDACGLSGTSALTHFHLAKVGTTGNNQFAVWGDENALGSTPAAVGLSFVYALGGGQDDCRWAVSTTPTSTSDRRTNGASNCAAAKSQHYSVVTWPGGAVSADNATWRINGTAQSVGDTTAGQTVTRANPNWSNNGARIASRPGNSALFNGDITMVGFWLVALSGTDLSTLERFAERWRIQ